MASTGNANIVVAKDGSGQFSDISSALAASERQRIDKSTRFVIYVKSGTYINENVIITTSMANITIIGDGIDKTIVSGSKSVNGDPSVHLFSTCTFGVEGEGFVAQDITFENTAGADKGQAVAFGSKSDQSVCYRCSFKGYQDTLYVHSNHQFYGNCEIYGTIDFIFGNASTIIQDCDIYVRKPAPSQHCVLTAQSRANPIDNTGISIHNSRINYAEGVHLGSDFPIYLGRPWGDYARTVVMKTQIKIAINPCGWEDWSCDKLNRRNTLYYGEYMNSDIGSDTHNRVKWPGMHPSLTETEASKFTVRNLLGLDGGDSWLKATGVPFTLDL